VVFLVALLVFGPDKLPEIGRQVGRGVRELRRFQQSLQHEVRDVFDPLTQSNEPPTLPPRRESSAGVRSVDSDAEVDDGEVGDAEHGPDTPAEGPAGAGPAGGPPADPTAG
jgi:TatA/E family protein of Tat protein translocase